MRLVAIYLQSWSACLPLRIEGYVALAVVSVGRLFKLGHIRYYDTVLYRFYLRVLSYSGNMLPLLRCWHQHIRGGIRLKVSNSSITHFARDDFRTSRFHILTRRL